MAEQATVWMADFDAHHMVHVDSYEAKLTVARAYVEMPGGTRTFDREKVQMSRDEALDALLKRANSDALFAAEMNKQAFARLRAISEFMQPETVGLEVLGDE